mmetsp:Transcript_29109/g.53310  ORF Transcript_29109/g.53310 Transcript_29109/m.53310 type:complete len:693 (-) Transcript_29109:362-2440(-)|eukprot:CAMPEP_0201653510 /NCGR_PEP_ID=MMETSP0493-20130528/45022_1 /ASSEMBLY_ACC=CAM_ASM_000838 /TAXON_ID=420259 /ORGANISM="Thalassiosira gravida, Strain GMp14c1" /LENGTH=692 /DNA_ID=CAMNT_0048130047 /DNA_START=1251 /DNA_END=3329 /DNA_ORIENTATION=-
MCRPTPSSSTAAAAASSTNSNNTKSPKSVGDPKSPKSLSVVGGTRGMSSSNSNKKERKGTSSTTNNAAPSSSKPAFRGAAFDADGYCVRHESVRLAEHAKRDGKLVWRELKMNCPKCATEHHKSRRVTSLGGAGKIKRGRTVHGMTNPLRSPSKNGRNMNKRFDTPFDDRGRCHHHPNVQMATRKARGGWKIVCQACPKCIEINWDEISVDSRASSRASSRRSRSKNDSGNDDNDDTRSVSSKSSKRSVTSRTKPVKSSGGKFDKNGCCTKHPTVQIAKKKLLGGWKEFRQCPKCLDPEYDDMADNVSLSSRTSRRSTTSFRSRGSVRSSRSKRSVKSGNGSRKGGRKTDRYGALPFDEEGYCHAHPSVRLAKKKALGGWKVLHDICPDCAHDASSNAGSSRSRSSRGTGRVFDDSGSETSSYKSGRSLASNASSSRKKKIRVKDMKYRDEHGRDGRYSGDVDEDHSPHGQGKMKYKDGSVFTGVWSEGSQVHGKTSKARSSKSSRSKGGDRDGSSGGKSSSKGGGSRKGSKSDWARIDDGNGGGGGSKSNNNGNNNDCGNSVAVTVSAGNKTANNAKTRSVRKMKWMDYYGDPGEYTGEVDGSNMPNGRGSMKYDHGLIQEGSWTKGQFVEGSDSNAVVASSSSDGKKSGGRSGGTSSGRKKSSSGGRSSGERSKKHHSSSRGSSQRGLDP